MSESNMGESDAAPMPGSAQDAKGDTAIVETASQVARQITGPVRPQARPGAAMDGLTRRERSILRFALHRFIHAAYEHATAAGQDKQKRFYREGAFSAFLADAADAEKLLGKIAED